MQMMKNQFKWFCKMKAISHNDLRMIFFYMDHYLFATFHWINISAIYNDPDPEKTQKDVLF